MPNILASLLGSRVAVVGGARGMGREIVKGFIDAGASPVVIDKLDSTVPDTPSFQVDVTDRQAVSAAFRSVDETLGGLDVMINTVGVSGRDTPSEEVEEEDWRAILDVNLSGAFWCCQEAAARMLPSGRGSIVNVSSLAGVLAARTYRIVHYHAAKAALNGLTRALAVEWGSRGVRINAIAPGAFATAAPMGLWQGDADRLKEHHARIAAATPIGRIGQEEEVAPLALFLASDAASYITGQVILCDGGRGIPID